MYFRDQKGAVAIEMAMISLPLFMIVFVIIDTSIAALKQYNLDHISNEIARCISLKGIYQSQQEFMDEVLCAKSRPFIDCEAVQLGITPVNGTVTSIDNSALTTGWNVGTSDDLMMIELSVPSRALVSWVQLHPTIQSSGEDYFFSRSIVRAEPFADSRSGESCDLN